MKKMLILATGTVEEFDESYAQRLYDFGKAVYVPEEQEISQPSEADPSNGDAEKPEEGKNAETEPVRETPEEEPKPAKTRKTK